MKKKIFLFLALVMCLSLRACGGGSANTPPSVEDNYAKLVEYATNGQYPEAMSLCQSNSDVLTYKDGQAYFDYCDAMYIYESGGIGFAYNKLKTVPDILNAKSTLDKIAERIGNLNGYYIEDNGLGAYLHMVIRDGLVSFEVIGYSDENQNFDYNAEDVHWWELVCSTYTNGTEFLGIGRYSQYYEEVEIDYALNIFDDSSEIMVIKFEGSDSEYTIFNGLYTKVAEVE